MVGVVWCGVVWCGVDTDGLVACLSSLKSVHRNLAHLRSKSKWSKGQYLADEAYQGEIVEKGVMNITDTAREILGRLCCLGHVCCSLTRVQFWFKAVWVKHTGERSRGGGGGGGGELTPCVIFIEVPKFNKHLAYLEE